jgi:hypothetical protein
VRDDLDKELTRRGHRFCRYADDCNIYVRSRLAIKERTWPKRTRGCISWIAARLGVEVMAATPPHSN